MLLTRFLKGVKKDCRQAAASNLLKPFPYDFFVVIDFTLLHLE